MNDFLISMFSLLFSLFGLGAAFQGISDKKETEKKERSWTRFIDGPCDPDMAKIMFCLVSGSLMGFVYRDLCIHSVVLYLEIEFILRCLWCWCVVY